MGISILNAHIYDLKKVTFTGGFFVPDPKFNYGFFVKQAGDVVVTTVKGTTETLPVGALSTSHIRFNKITEAGTTVTDIWALQMED